jgi:hypothetical protein
MTQVKTDYWPVVNKHIYRTFICDNLAFRGEFFAVSRKHEEFRPRTLYSLQNAFTPSFQKLHPIPMYRATTSAGEYFAAFGG